MHRGHDPFHPGIHAPICGWIAHVQQARKEPRIAPSLAHKLQTRNMSRSAAVHNMNSPSFLGRPVLHHEHAVLDRHQAIVRTID
jgi:hypothetical protein